MYVTNTGNGNVILGSPVDGYQTFANAGVTNGTVVSYVIVDGNSWEVGSGTYLTTNTTLAARTIYQSSTGSLINMSNAAVVSLSQLPADLDNGFNKCKQIPGRYYSCDIGTFGGGTATITAGILYFYPFSRDIIADALAMEVTTASASAAIRMGVYSCTPSGGIGKLIEEATAVSQVSAGTTGIKVATFATPRHFVEPVWLAIISNTTITTGVRAYGDSGQSVQRIGSGSLSTSYCNAVVATQTYGPLPNTVVSSLSFGTTLTLIAFRAGGGETTVGNSSLYPRTQMTVSGTPGTGTLVLNANTTGFQSLASAKVSNYAIVAYLITDSNDSTIWESGMANCTIINGVYNLNRFWVETSSNSGALVSATANSIVTLKPRALALLNGSNKVRQWKSGLYFCNDLVGPTTAVNTITTGQMVFLPFSREILANGIAFEVTTAVSSSTVRVGIYAMDNIGTPTSLIIEPTATTPISSATTGVKTITFPNLQLSFPFYIALAASGAVGFRYGIDNLVTGNILGQKFLNTDAWGALSQTFTYAAFPATAPSSGTWSQPSPFNVSIIGA